MQVIYIGCEPGLRHGKPRSPNTSQVLVNVLLRTNEARPDRQQFLESQSAFSAPLSGPSRAYGAIALATLSRGGPCPTGREPERMLGTRTLEAPEVYLSPGRDRARGVLARESRPRPPHSDRRPAAQKPADCAPARALCARRMLGDTLARRRKKRLRVARPNGAAGCGVGREIASVTLPGRRFLNHLASSAVGPSVRNTAQDCIDLWWPVWQCAALVDHRLNGTFALSQLNGGHARTLQAGSCSSVQEIAVSVSIAAEELSGC